MTLPLDAPSSLATEGWVNPLGTHRRQVTVVFIDLRGFTETAEPEDMVQVLREYHTEMGRLVVAHAGALERFTRHGGMIFFDDRVSVPNYPTVIGTVTNLAARLCEEAKPGQILVSRRVFAAVEHVVEAEPIGDLTFKGFLGPERLVYVRER